MKACGLHGLADLELLAHHLLVRGARGLHVEDEIARRREHLVLQFRLIAQADRGVGWSGAIMDPSVRSRAHWPCRRTPRPAVRRSRLPAPGPRRSCFADRFRAARHHADGAVLELGDLAERIERGVGQLVDRRLVVAERHEHRAARRTVVGAGIQRDAAAARLDGHHVARPCRPWPARSSGCTSATGSGSMASSTVARRVMLPVCQCSSWRPVISTIGYSASGRSSAGMMSAGTKRRAPALAREVVDEHHRLAGIAFLRARIGDRMLALQPLPGDAGDAGHGVAHFVEHFATRGRTASPGPGAARSPG